MTQQFLAADVSGSAPDVIWASLDQVANAVEQGALADLKEVAFADTPDDQLAELQDTYWTSMEQDDGTLPGIVHSRNYFGIMYRKDLLEEQGVDAEEIATWDDLVEAAQKLTSSADGTWGLGQAFATSFADPQIISALIMDGQGAMFGDDGAPTWATDAGVAAMKRQVAFIDEDKVTPSDAVRLTAEDLYEVFSAGQAAMINGASSRVPAMQEQVGAENVGFMHYPSEDGSTPASGNLAGWSVGVWEGSEAKEQAGAFVAHLSSPEADETWLLDGQQPPLYPSTAEKNADFLDKPENAFLRTVLEGAQEVGWLAPTNAPANGWREAINEAVQQVMLDGTDPMEALTTAEGKVGKG
jgi:ABC-type glycerol-3-phosphate transport system substrate-binding protein